jgi:hypothetical protein
MSEKTIVSKQGLEISVSEEGSVNIELYSGIRLLSPAEFDALSMHSPLAIRMSAILDLIKLGGSQKHMEFVRKESIKLLAEIAALTENHAEVKK